MSKFEDLTNKIAEKRPSKAKPKRKDLRKVGNLKESESEFEEKVRQKMKNKKI